MFAVAACYARKAETASMNASTCSIWGRLPASGMVTSCEPGISALNAWPYSGGICPSDSPQTTSVGDWMRWMRFSRPRSGNCHRKRLPEVCARVRWIEISGSRVGGWYYCAISDMWSCHISVGSVRRGVAK